MRLGLFPFIGYFFISLFCWEDFLFVVSWISRLVLICLFFNGKFVHFSLVAYLVRMQVGSHIYSGFRSTFSKSIKRDPASDP